MTIKIDINKFILDSINRIFKQVHLNDRYSIGLFSPKEIPQNTKNLCKGIIPSDFFNGEKTKILSLKIKDVSSFKEEDKIKITNFIKTTFFLSEDSAFSSNDVYQIKDVSEKEKDKPDNDEDDKDDENINNIYFFVKLDISNFSK